MCSIETHFLSYKPAFMLLGEAAKAIEGKLSECDARLGEAVGSMPASDLP